jgi:hypothetical protein
METSGVSIDRPRIELTDASRYVQKLFESQQISAPF